MKIDDRIYDMTTEDLRNKLVGKTIASVDEDRNVITLTDGTELRFIDTQECCAWFSASLSEGNLVDNAVTDVVVQEWHGTEEVPKAWTLRVLAADKNLVDVDISGDSTTGYYCRSINLTVVAPE